MGRPPEVHEKIYRIRKKSNNGVQSSYVPRLPAEIFNDPKVVSIDEYLLHACVYQSQTVSDNYRIENEIRECPVHSLSEHRKYRVREKGRILRYQWRCMECLADKRRK